MPDFNLEERIFLLGILRKRLQTETGRRSSFTGDKRKASERQREEQRIEGRIRFLHALIEKIRQEDDPDFSAEDEETDP